MQVISSSWNLPGLALHPFLFPPKLSAFVNRTHWGDITRIYLFHHPEKKAE
jgi:hypothetical protein